MSIRRHPRVRALARRHAGVMLRRAKSWTNVDSVLRLLAEDSRRGVVFARCADPLLDLLYWQPFVRWAETHFGLASGDEPVRIPPEPVLALVAEYRRGDAPPRPLLKRARHERLDERTAGGIVPWSAEAVGGMLSGTPTIAILPEAGAVEPDLDLASKVACELGETLPILSREHLTRLLQALRGPEPELQ